MLFHIFGSRHAFLRRYLLGIHALSLIIASNVQICKPEIACGVSRILGGRSDLTGFVPRLWLEGPLTSQVFPALPAILKTCQVLPKISGCATGSHHGAMQRRRCAIGSRHYAIGSCRCATRSCRRATRSHRRAAGSRRSVTWSHRCATGGHHGATRSCCRAMGSRHQTVPV